MASKLELEGERVKVSATEAIALLKQIFVSIGCDEGTALMVATHLADASLCGVESHGLTRTLQYAEQFNNDYMHPGAKPEIVTTEQGIKEVDGHNGIGIPAMSMAVEMACELATYQGIAAVPLKNVGHTGRLGAFADEAAVNGFLTISIGGGNRKVWRQVAPHGGTKALLPTNPWCVGIPGGARGPVVLDFATSKIAGGWIYAARSAGAKLPPDCVIDANGNPTTDPEDYFKGGAILPAGGAKGYALALMAELIAEAILGPVTTEANWLVIALEVSRYGSHGYMQNMAEDILAEIRDCPPGPGFTQVEVPGERERDARTIAKGQIDVPEKTWIQLQSLAQYLAKINK